MKIPSILVVDDEPDNFDVIEALLSVGSDTDESSPDPGYQLQYASSGTAALDSLEMFQPDLILLDVMMPGIDGIEVCRRIKAMPQWQPVPIIMITALTAKDDLARCLKSGADDFISKPVNGMELRARVHSMLRIKQQYDDLQALLQSREDMVKMIVHDLRNPLTNILLGVGLLRSGKYPEDRVSGKLAQMQSAAQKLQLLIDDLLKIALIESGKVCLNCKDVDLYDIVKSAISNFTPIATQKDQTLVWDLPNEPERIVSVDPAMIHRTLDNLLSNAIKFSPHNSEIGIAVEFLTTGEYKIQVSDAGPGVPEELREKIFEKYEVGTVMSAVSQIGLGLAFCKMVVEAHNGKISVRDNGSIGSVFEIVMSKSS